MAVFHLLFLFTIQAFVDSYFTLLYSPQSRLFRVLGLAWQSTGQISQLLIQPKAKSHLSAVRDKRLVLIDEYITSASLMGSTWAHCKFLLTNSQAQQVAFSSLRMFLVLLENVLPLEELELELFSELVIDLTLSIALWEGDPAILDQFVVLVLHCMCGRKTRADFFLTYSATETAGRPDQHHLHLEDLLRMELYSIYTSSTY